MNRDLASQNKQLLEEIEGLRDQILEATIVIAKLGEIAIYAMRWAYCPPQGGYKNGVSIEDTCEALSEAVLRFTDLPYSEDHLTEEEVTTRLGKLQQEQVKKETH